MQDNTLEFRQTLVYTLLAGLFLGTLGMVNLLGISHFIDFSFQFGNHSIPMLIPFGVLPYPLTFLCIDLICELFGKQKANTVVIAGLFINLWIVFVIWLAGILPAGHGADASSAFYQIRQLTFGAVGASMVAYLLSQLLDVFLYQFWRKLTQGKHLWLRTNGSTIISQVVDTTIVISLTALFCSSQLHSESITETIQLLVLSSLAYKVIMSMLGTIPFYIAVHNLKRYLAVTPTTPASLIYTESKSPV